MTKQEQIDFINLIIDDSKEHLLHIMDTKEIPENWDGVELRWFIRDYFNYCIWYPENDKRKREYKNDILVNNLI